MATYSCHWRIMGKVEIGIYCYLTVDILTKFYRNVPWVVLFEAYEFCPNCWIWLVTMATERLNLRKNIKKIVCSEAIRGTKLKLCRTYGIDVKPSNSASKDAFCTTVLRWRKARVVPAAREILCETTATRQGQSPLIHSAGIFTDIFFSPLNIFLLACRQHDSNPCGRGM